MAPLKGSQGVRRSLAPKQAQEFFELGKQGRKTGITLRDTGVRDEHGMEPIDGIFSSPEKKRANNEDEEDDSEDDDDDEDEDVPMELTTASGPFPSNAQGRLPVPRSKSPRKTNLKSPATRNIFRGDKSSSPTVTGALSTSAARPVKRRLDFEMESQTKGKAAAAASSSQQSNRGGKVAPTKARARAQEVESEEEEDEQDDQSDIPDTGVDGGDDSMQIVDTAGGNDYSIPSEEEEEEEDIPRAAPAKPAAGKRRRSGRLSLDDEDAAEPAAEEEPKAKRTKTGPAPKGKKPAPAPKQKAPVAAKKPAAAPASKEDSAPKKRGRKPKVAADDVGETSELNIKQGPALPKVNGGLLISRNENLAAATHTRSGRASVKPLAYWRNERIEYERDVEEDDFVSGDRKFVLPVMKEIHRVDEPAAPIRKKYPRSGRSSRKSRAAEEDDEDMEPWEEDPGQILGDVRVWQPEHETDPPMPDDPVDYAQVQIALAGNAITTKPVANATFRFAKTLNLPFFGSGVVDLPPGAEKTQKNARRMQMVFVVLTGRVVVTVAETEFRIGKGGMWFVARGNYYGIRNESDSDARVFFAQGCEVQIDPSANNSQ